MANNILQQVATYNESGLALLLNSFAFISSSNKKFQRFNENIPKNLGDTVTFDKPPRFRTVNSLVASFEPAVQRVQSLTVDKQVSTAYEFSAQQFVLNVKDYMPVFGRSAVSEIGSKIEADVAGLAESNTFRYYGDGVNQISSFAELANALAFYRNFGAPKSQAKGFLSDLTVPNIVNSGLGQFVLDRNQKMANSWELGSFSNCEWMTSNLLKTHVAGDIGKNALTLTVTGVTIDPSINAVVAISFSSALLSNANAVKKYDKFTFNDGVALLPNLRFLTFIGGHPSQSPVQFQAKADAASDGAGNITVQIDPPLSASVAQGQSLPGSMDTQYINEQIQAGMRVRCLPDHRCGLIYAGDPLFLAMPKLPEEVPFPTSVVTDPDSGASLRQYYGSLFAKNQRGMVHDCIYGFTLVPEYSMMLALAP